MIQNLNLECEKSTFSWFYISYRKMTVVLTNFVEYWLPPSICKNNDNNQKGSVIIKKMIVNYLLILID
jgi:hypothetical protein